MVLVEAEDDGHRGIGWTYGPALIADLVMSELAPAVGGDVATSHEAMCRAVRNAGRPGLCSMAISAVDCAPVGPDGTSARRPAAPPPRHRWRAGGLRAGRRPCTRPRRGARRVTPRAGIGGPAGPDGATAPGVTALLGAARPT